MQSPTRQGKDNAVEAYPWRPPAALSRGLSHPLPRFPSGTYAGDARRDRHLSERRAWPGIYLSSRIKIASRLAQRWGQIQYAMQAIIAIYRGLPPEHFNASTLTERFASI